MKKNRLFMLGIVTVFVAILSLTLVSSTFAKYTSTVTGEDSAKVAKWAWTYTGTHTGGADEIDLSSAKTVDFDIFKVVYDLDNNDLVNKSAEETDIERTEGIEVAPGTGGFYTFSVTNASEVTAKATFTFAALANSTLPIEFSTTNLADSWTDDLAEINAQIDEQTLAVGATSTEVTLYWRWAFNGDDDIDTNHGIADSATYGVKLTVVFEQVN